MKNTHFEIHYTEVREAKINGKWTIESPEISKCITYEQYHMIVGPKTLKFYRSINSPQIITRYRNGKVKRLISVSPDRTERIVYNFTFIPIANENTIINKTE